MGWAEGDSLAYRLRVAFGASLSAAPGTWAWTDVTPWLHMPEEITIEWGRSDRAEQAESSKLTVTLKNGDGRFTAYHGGSPYWPNVRKWTPISFDLDLGDGSGWRNRFSGFVRRWPVTWPGGSSSMALAKIEAVGTLGRLGRGSPPALSPLRRAITSRANTAGLLAYWPCEDEADSTLAASGIPGRQPLTAVGAITFAALDPSQSVGGTFRYGTAPLPDLSAGGGLIGGIAPTGTTSPVGWTVQWTAQEASGGSAPGEYVVVSWQAGASLWEVLLTGPPSYNTALRVDGTIRILDSTSFLGFYEWRVRAWQNGSNINAQLVIDGVSLGNTTPGGTGPWTASWAGTLDWPGNLAINPRQSISNPAKHLFGHLQVWDGTTPPSYAGFGGIDGYGVFVGSVLGGAKRGEAAHDRLARLCAEDGIPCAVAATPASGDETRMGAQPDAAPLTLYQECETADQGLLYEQGWGIGYLPRASRYNAPVALTVDAAAGQLGRDLTPVDDDSALRNRWTVSRPGGSSATAEDLDSIDQQGMIESSVEARLAEDGPLLGHAAWRLRLSTVAEPRYPALSLDLSSAAGRPLAAAWCALRPGSRVQVLHPPPQAPPGPIDQLVVGASEVFAGRRSWWVGANLSPSSAWQVAEADGEPRVPADGSTLAVEATAGAMTLSVTSTGGLWTTDPADFPQDLMVGGEQVTVSAISGTSSPQTATVIARAVNGVSRAWPAGTPVDVLLPAVAPL